MKVTSLMVLLGTAFKNLFRKPATVMFPAEHVPLPEGFRGEPLLDEELCIACRRCERVCPSGAIVIEKLDAKHFRFDLNVGRCLFCQECEKSCPKDAIYLSHEWLLASGEKHKLVRTYLITRGGASKKKEEKKEAAS